MDKEVLIALLGLVTAVVGVVAAIAKHKPDAVLAMVR
jgi:hypothetical protein